MAWELYIHQIDVAQGDSTLIVARETVAGTIRSMIVDGGRSYHAETVHTYVAANIFGQAAVDRIVTTHYDIDHSGGIQKLLIADNRYELASTIASAAGAAASATANAAANTGQLNQVASGAAAAAAAALGTYNDTNNGNYDAAAVAAGVAGRTALQATSNTNALAAKDGFDAGTTHANGIVLRNPILIPGPTKRPEVCKAAGIAAGTTAGTAVARTAAALAVIEPLLETMCPEDSRFVTNGLYRTSNVIDVGDGTVTSPHEYRYAVSGRFNMSANNVVRAPNINRTRTTPALSDEILWNTGANPQAAPAGAPAVFVVAINRYVRNAPNNSVPIVGNPTNSVGIGLVVRFNNFFFYTGGDLPYMGEDLVLRDLLSTQQGNGLPDPQNPGQFFAAPNHICAFKCGHHGAATSNSPNFISRIRAVTAMISTGGNLYDHPDQSVVNSLYNDTDIREFYFTNLNWTTNHVPASNGQNQITTAGTKGFISGDNAILNVAVGRNRGNIEIRVNAAESLSNVHPPTALGGGGAVYHQLRLCYWEEDWGTGPSYVTGTWAH